MVTRLAHNQVGCLLSDLGWWSMWRQSWLFATCLFFDCCLHCALQTLLRTQKGRPLGSVCAHAGGYRKWKRTYRAQRIHDSLPTPSLVLSPGAELSTLPIIYDSDSTNSIPRWGTPLPYTDLKIRNHHPRYKIPKDIVILRLYWYVSLRTCYVQLSTT